MRNKLKTQKPHWRDHPQHLHSIANAALAAVDPYEAVRRHLQLENNHLVIEDEKVQLEDDTRIYVVGAGKAGVAMARAAEEILGERIYGSIISVPDLPTEPLSVIQLSQGGHPLPTEGSIQAGNQMRDLLSQTCEKDLVLVLISGGGSALLELPLEGLELSDLQKVNDLLIKSGAPIQDINIVRRQLSMIKGGGLARLAAPARTIALILSDVVGDPLEAIASGPTTASRTTLRDVWEVLERYNLVATLPENVDHALETSVEARMKYPGTSKGRLENIIIGSNKVAVEAAVAHAIELGFKAILLTTMLQGEAKDVGRLIAALMKAVKLPPTQSASPLCMVLGGETTVTLRGSGIGGRNQELALAAAVDLEGIPHVAMMTLATDGIDGPTPSAGAIIHGETIVKGRALHLDALAFLANNDSYSFFNAFGDTVILGPTGTNVNDLIICLIYGA